MLCNVESSLYYYYVGFLESLLQEKLEDTGFASFNKSSLYRHILKSTATSS